jgi:hypothetical protein
MSSLREIDRRPLERLLEMGGGFVLDFTDRTFGEFFQDEASVDIHSARYTSHGSSKANKLRAFWRVESDSLVGKTLMALIDCSIESLTEMSTDHYALVEQCRSIAQRLMATGPNLGTLKDRAVTINAVHLVEQIRRMEQSIDADPALAVGTAKELVETVCKTILAERGKPAAGTPDLPALTKMTMRELRLMPDGVPSAAKGAETAKRILGNLATIAQGLAELRNLYGTGHGRHEDTGSIKPRHAKLAVGAAATLATFLFETHKEVV